MKTIEILIHSPAIGDSITLRHVSDDTGSVLALFKGVHLLVMLDPYPWHDGLVRPQVIEALALHSIHAEWAEPRPVAHGAAYYVASSFEVRNQRSEQP
jgi:hypothetical protein